MGDPIEIRHEGRIAILTLNRPGQMNAITPDMREALLAALAGVAAAAGEAFDGAMVAGADLRGRLMQSADHRERIAAFLERRQAEFAGR